MFDNTKLPLRLWMGAIYLMATHKKGVSSHQLGRDLDISQVSAWFMLHRLRFGFQHKNYKEELAGTIEVDEAYVGGKLSNKHANKQTKYTIYEKIDETSRSDDKTVVFGAVQRGGSIIARHVPNNLAKTLVPLIVDNVKSGSTIYSDMYYACDKLPDTFTKDTVNHSIKEYVRGRVHTNTIENYWSVLKWTLVGTYKQISKKHFQKYLNESAFRYNTRNLESNFRFNLYLCSTEMRLTFNQLVANPDGTEKDHIEKRRYTRKIYRQTGEGEVS